MSTASTASTSAPLLSPRTPVLVKTLAGDLIALEVDPTEGLSGVEKALTAMDPATYPVGSTCVFPIDTEEAVREDTSEDKREDTREAVGEATSEAVGEATRGTEPPLLGVFIDPTPLCRLLEYNPHLYLPGDSQRRYTGCAYHAFHFQLSTGSRLYLYVPLASTKKDVEYPRFVLDIEPLTMTRRGGIYHLHNLMSELQDAYDTTPRDRHILLRILQTRLPAHITTFYPGMARNDTQFYCACGCLVRSGDYGHEDSPRHRKGNIRGRRWMARVEQMLLHM